MKRIIECVPNFSEGRDKEIITAIVEAIAGCDNQAKGTWVKVLHVDSGEAANRTVITFAGSPEAVVEAAFEAVRTAGELIDMRKHHGEHPRSGATDVLPLVPVSGVTLEECAQMARDLAKRIYEQLGIPCYCYEAAALKDTRCNLAVCRAGEYEALEEKIADPERRPDFGPETYNGTVARSGAVNVGARDFLIAVNFNLNSADAALAHEIACDVRERGRRAEDGTVIPGLLKGCKAIGWYIEDYRIAQVSMNITDINATPLHVAYEQVCKAAIKYGLEVTGTEIIGLVPKRVLVDAGIHFLKAAMQDDPAPVGEDQLIEIAVHSMGLYDLKPFIPKEKIIEYLIRKA